MVIINRKTCSNIPKIKKTNTNIHIAGYRSIIRIEGTFFTIEIVKLSGTAKRPGIKR